MFRISNLEFRNCLGFRILKLGFILTLLFIFMPTHIANAGIIGKPPSNLGLVGYWSFNEGIGPYAGDSSGNRNQGTLTNGPTWVDGKRGKALSFDGSNDYVDAGGAILDTVTNKFTVSVWVKNGVGNQGTFFVANTASTGDLYDWGLYNAFGSNVYCFYIKNVSNVIVNSCSTSLATVGMWIHVVGVYYGTNTSIYISGVQEDSDIQTGNVKDTGYNTRIGRWTDTLPFFRGAVDEVRVYNRALTPSEVEGLYKSGAAKFTSPSNLGLVGYWSMNEGIGPYAGDSSGNKNTGTLTNGPTWVDGKQGKALNFDGVNDYVDLGSPASLNGTGSHTISLWANLNDIGALGNYDVFFEKNSDCGAGAGWGMVVYYSTPSTWAAAVVTTSGGAVNYSALGTSPTPTIGTWVHLVGVYDNSAQTITLYTDGVSRQTTNTGNTLRVGDNSTIGVQKPNTCTLIDLANAKIDDVRVYNRALSADEVKALYRSGEVAKNVSQDNKLTSGLVGYWSFDGNKMGTTSAWDVSGNGNTGWLINGAKKVAGKIGQALKFDGVDDYVQLGNVNPVAGATGLTMSAWVYRTANELNGSILVKWCDNCTGRALYLALSGSNVFAAVKGANGNSLYGNSTGDAVSVLKWHHIVAEWSAASPTIWKVYVDGVLQGFSYTVQASIDAIGAEAAPLTIGVRQNAWAGSFIGFFNGLIDDVRVYNRALSPDEIKRLYNMGR